MIKNVGLIFIRISKIGRLFIYIIRYLIAGFIILKSKTDPTTQRKRLIQNIQKYSQLAIDLFNINTTLNNPPSKDKNYLLVSNHFGYLDVLILITKIPSLFVTSIEMKETPLIGLMTQIGSCLYVERRSRSQIKSEMKEIETALRDGYNVVLFPEGTSGDGTQLLPFKKSLLMSCSQTNANILPLVFNYRKVNNKPINQNSKKAVFWYGEISFLESIWNLSAVSSVEVEISILNEIPVAPESDLKQIAEVSYQQIASQFIPITS